MNRFLPVLAVLISLWAGPASAATPVEVISTAPGNDGSRFVFALKERIPSSSSLEKTVDASKPRMQVLIVTIDPGVNSGMTAYSVVITWKNPAQPYPMYLTQYVGTVGTSHISEAADGMAAGISEQADALLSLYQNAPKAK